ncbi:MAG TPA: hypothetical protein VGJ54_01535 [Streptosporangiaceae bacterium]|jgi:hypothetical protein
MPAPAARPQGTGGHLVAAGGASDTRKCPNSVAAGRSRWTDSSRAAPALVRPYVKCGIYRNHTWKRHTDARPLTYTTITALEVAVHQPEPPKPRPRPTPA